MYVNRENRDKKTTLLTLHIDINWIRKLVDDAIKHRTYIKPCLVYLNTWYPYHRVHISQIDTISHPIVYRVSRSSNNTAYDNFTISKNIFVWGNSNLWCKSI